MTDEMLPELSNNALMDAWWTASEDDWPVPEWLPRKFLAECAERGWVLVNRGEDGVL